MRYHCLACDYDGTLAHHGRVGGATIAALDQVRATGRKLVLVTGRQLDELQRILPDIALFDRVVAENGALLYRPGTREEHVLGPSPPHEFVAALRCQGVQPISVGRVIVATWQPHETTVLQVIRQSGLELRVIFNKGAVMVLPAGITKATGLAVALRELELSPHEVVGVGDAENDHAFLTICEAAVAVANALPAVKDRADLVTRGDHGHGVRELIDALLDDDLRALGQKITRHHLVLGQDGNGAAVMLPPYDVNLLVADSGGERLSDGAGVIERLIERRYQFCMIDPDGAGEPPAGVIVLGSTDRGPTVDDILDVLQNVDANVVANVAGLPNTDRPPFFLSLLARFREMRARSGRPHWLILKDAHHLLPVGVESGAHRFPPDLKNLIFIARSPEQVRREVLDEIDAVIASGSNPGAVMEKLRASLGVGLPANSYSAGPAGGMLVWYKNPNLRSCRAAHTIAEPADVIPLETMTEKR